MLSTLMAGITLGGTLATFIIAILVMSRKQLFGNLWNISEDFISARGSQSWDSIGLSLFAGYFGVWALTIPPELCILAGSWGVIAYATSIILPWLPFILIGPTLRQLMGKRGFTVLEFLEERFGRRVQLVIGVGSLFNMWIFLLVELIAIGNCFKVISPGFPFEAAPISIAVVTIFYTTFGGLRGSILTDKIQGVLILLLIVACYIAVFTSVAPHISSQSWSDAFFWETDGIITSLAFIMSCLFIEIMNPATWQRVFASKSDAHMRGGFLMGSLVGAVILILLGSTGSIAKAAKLSNLITMSEGQEAQALFILLAKLPDVWLLFAAILGTGLASSSVDSLQTGMAATITSDLIKRGHSLNWARIFCILLNIPAVIISVYNPPSILKVFLATNVVMMSLGPAIFLGFSSRVTSNGVLAGISLALSSIFAIGFWRVGFVKGLTWFTFPNGFNWECLFTLCTELVLAVGGTYGFSYLEYIFRREVFEEQQMRFQKMKDDAANNAEGEKDKNCLNGHDITTSASVTL